MRSRKSILLVATVILALVNLGVTLTRSTIPLALDGTIESIEFLSEGNPGIDDIYVLRVGEKEVHVDRAIAKQLTVGVHVSKEAWSSELTAGRQSETRTVELSPSEDFTGMAITMPIAMIGVLVLLSKKARSTWGEKGEVRGPRA